MLMVSEIRHFCKLTFERGIPADIDRNGVAHWQGAISTCPYCKATLPTHNIPYLESVNCKRPKWKIHVSTVID